VAENIENMAVGQLTTKYFGDL